MLNRTAAAAAGAGAAAAAAAADTADVMEGMGIELDKSASPGPDGTPAYKGVICNHNNYGLDAPVHELSVQPCIPCPTNMVTGDHYKSNITGELQSPLNYDAAIAAN
jgi:hypothetical protein